MITLKCPFKTGHYEALFQGAGQFIINDLAAVPVNDDEYIHESFTHSKVGDVDFPKRGSFDLLEPRFF